MSIVTLIFGNVLPNNFVAPAPAPDNSSVFVDENANTFTDENGNAFTP